MRKYWFSLLFLFLFLSVVPGREATVAQEIAYLRSDRLGITHISAANRPIPPERYQQALDLGAGWNRWPIYWQWVQLTPDTWEWSGYDQQVTDDLNHGLKINAILIGKPPFLEQSDSVPGINEPIFSDGSDIPGVGKAFSPENPWVYFVWQAVNRYKPGGLLSQQADIPPGAGIRVWEVWNEPDFEMFWQGGSLDYARLLKVTYIVTKMADPNAQVMIGGLLYPDGGNLLAEVLNSYVEDPQRDANNWYLDLVAIHSYGDPSRSGWLTIYVRETLRAFNLDRPIWLNETGVPVWDDYPGPVWAPDSNNRATLDQQAWFFIQSAAYAWSEGADKVILHQLYDDCGDQPPGTDFPPHNGNLCTDTGLCYGDAHGIFRNPPSAQCFTQHPQPGTARPLAEAYRLTAQVFGTESFDRGDSNTADSRFTVITFERPRTNERVSVMWNRTTTPQQLEYPAVGSNGALLSIGSFAVVQPDAEGIYRIDLPPALPDSDLSTTTEDETVAIGGKPFILIEPIAGAIPIIQAPPGSGPDDTGILPTPVPPPPTLPPPTAAPVVDAASPQVTVNPLPTNSPNSFTVSWQGTDDTGIEMYIVWVRVNRTEWRPWLETTETSATYTGSDGDRVEFAAWALDIAGNWSENVPLQVQAFTNIGEAGAGQSFRGDG